MQWQVWGKGNKNRLRKGEEQRREKKKKLKTSKQKVAEEVE